MTQNINKILYISIFVLVFSSVTLAEITVSQSISNEEIAFEDSVQFQIVVEWEGSQTDYLFHKPLTPFIDRMKIGKFSSSVSSLMRNGEEFTQKKYNYTLIPTSAGLGIVDSISIGYLKRNDTIPNFLVTEPMNVLIAIPVAKEAEEKEINEWYIVGAILIILFGLFAFLRYKKSKSVEVVISPKEMFLEELTEIKKNAESDMKIFQTELYTVLSKYLVTAYNVDVAHVQKDKLIDELSTAGLSIANSEQLRDWIEQAEIDKFAPISQTPGGVIRLESEIRTFFEKI